MTDQSQRTESWNEAPRAQQTNPNLAQECYGDNSAFRARSSGNGTANLPTIEFYAGDGQPRGIGNSSLVGTTPGDSPSASKLISKLGDTNSPEKQKAIEALKDLGPNAIPELLKAAKDGNPEVAATAKSLLEEIAGKPVDTLLRDGQSKGIG